jgi:hypothetical protein
MIHLIHTDPHEVPQVQMDTSGIPELDLKPLIVIIVAKQDI